MVHEARASRRRGLAWLALATGLAGSAALVLHERRALAEHVLLWQLARRGLADASLTVTSFGPRELVLRDLRIGDGDLVLAGLVLRYSVAKLAAGRLDAVRVVDLRLRGRIDEGGLDLGALDALRTDSAAPQAAGPPGIPLLPVGRLEVDRASLHVDTPHGAFEAALALVLDEGGRGRFTATTGPLATFDTPVGVAAAPFALAGDVAFGPDRFEALLEPAPFSLTLATRSGPQPITGTTPRLALRGGADLAALELVGSGGALSALGPGVAAEGIGFELRIDPEARLPEGSVSVEALRDARARFPACALAARLSPADGALHLEGELRSELPGVAARFAGRHDAGTGEGGVDVEVGPLRFGERGLEPGDLFPALGERLRSAVGELAARGELRWGGDGLGGVAEIGLRDLALETELARIEGLNAALRFEGPSPLRTPRGQLVSMARIDFGLELTDGLLRGSLRPGGAIDLESAEWRFAGGVLRTAGALDPFAARQELAFAVADLDLAELLALVALEGLEGSGRLSGRLPLSLEEGRLRIAGAELRASEEGGSLRYRPRGRDGAALGGAGAALDDFLLALHDFHYDTLVLRVNGDAQGEVAVAISLAGANPEHREGQRYEFNLNVEGRLSDLLREESAAYRVPDEIQKRLDALSGSR